MILVAAVLLAGGLTGLFLLIFRERSKASLIATCWVIVFFSYGQVYNVAHTSLGTSIGRNVILLPVAFGLMLLSLVWIWKWVRNPAWLVTFFGWMVAILCLMSFYTIGRYYLSVGGDRPACAAGGRAGSQFE